MGASTFLFSLTLFSYLTPIDAPRIVANFGTDATGFSRLFPGLKPHLLTLASNFQLPLYRELLLSLGVCSVSMKSCQNILRQGAPVQLYSFLGKGELM